MTEGPEDGMSESQSSHPVAIVTGGARGIGWSTAEILARRGHFVVIADIDAAQADEAARRLVAAGHGSSGIGVDVGVRADVERLVAEVMAAHGRIDVLVNNAGIAGRAVPLVDVTDEDWDVMLRVDLTSVFLCCRAVLPHMLSRRQGSIVNVASISGKEGNPNMVPYSAAKAGVIALTKAVAKEVAASGVRVNAVAPAVIETDILSTLTPDQVAYMRGRIPMNRFGRPEEAAEVIAFLASASSSFVTGQCYDVSGGRATY
jgi:NAD(P)-dependent dehydrogenase (short-subunit alcohol dehydrogenase family)